MGLPEGEGTDTYFHWIFPDRQDVSALVGRFQYWSYGFHVFAGSRRVTATLVTSVASRMRLNLLRDPSILLFRRLTRLPRHDRYRAVAPTPGLSI